MFKFFKQLRRNEDGAVTVDWVALTAATILLGVIVLNSISTDATTAVTDINDEMATYITP